MKKCNSCKQEKEATEFYAKKYSCISCVSLHNKKWREANKEKKKTLNRDWWYKNTYGISYDEFMSLSQKQNNKCKICSVNLVFEGKSKESAVLDHNHATGKIRGVLCNACNVALGHFKDNIDAINNAIRYLKENEN